MSERRLCDRCGLSWPCECVEKDAATKEYTELRTAFDEALALLKKIDHTSQEYAWCLQCDGTTHFRGETFRHAPDCRLAAFLKRWGNASTQRTVVVEGVDVQADGRIFAQWQGKTFELVEVKK
jgi:hypothetical protein